MAEPSTAAASSSVTYLVVTILKLNAEWLVIGALMALVAIGRQPPLTTDTNLSTKRQLIMALCNIASISLLSAAATKVIILLFPAVSTGGIGIAALIGFFGQQLISAGTEFIAKGWKARFGVKDES